MEETDEVQKSIYDLKLHEVQYGEMKWGWRTNVIRVPGGWIYRQINRSLSGTDTCANLVFVPFNEEFKK